MKQYRKRPVVIDAIQLTEEMKTSPPFPVTYHAYVSEFDVETLEGRMWGCVGDWLIKGIEGEHYFCKDGIFQKTYMQVFPVSDEVLNSKLPPSPIEQLRAS